MLPPELLAIVVSFVDDESLFEVSIVLPRQAGREAVDRVHRLIGRATWIGKQIDAAPRVGDLVVHPRYAYDRFLPAATRGKIVAVTEDTIRVEWSNGLATLYERTGQGYAQLHDGKPEQDFPPLCPADFFWFVAWKKRFDGYMSAQDLESVAHLAAWDLGAYSPDLKASDLEHTTYYYAVEKIMPVVWHRHGSVAQFRHAWRGDAENRRRVGALVADIQVILRSFENRNATKHEIMQIESVWKQCTGFELPSKTCAACRGTGVQVRGLTMRCKECGPVGRIGSSLFRVSLGGHVLTD